MGQNDDMKDKVEIVAILSMSGKEIDDALEIVRCTEYFLHADYQLIIYVINININ